MASRNATDGVCAHIDADTVRFVMYTQWPKHRNSMQMREWASLYGLSIPKHLLSLDRSQMVDLSLTEESTRQKLKSYSKLSFRCGLS